MSRRTITRRQFGATSIGFLVTTTGVVSGCGGGGTSESPPALSGAGNSTAPTAPTGEKKVVTYAIIPKMLNNPFFDVAHNGALKAERDLEAGDAAIDVKIEFQSSSTGQTQEQVEIIRQMVQRKVDGLAISVIDANAVRDVIKEAVEAGIPTICWDSDCPDSERRTFYGVDNEQMGVELGNQLVLACGGKLQPGDKIALISGQASAPNLQDRTKGALSVLNKHAGIKILETLYCDDKPEKAIQQISTTMAANPDLRGWVFVGGWPLFADNALDSIRDHERTKVVSADALEPEWQYLESGACQALVAQRPFSYGEESIKILDNLRTGKKTDYPAIQEAPVDLVYKETSSEQKAYADKAGIKAYSLDEYRTQWKEWNQKA